jgi:glycosyltransferase involved in cell wall biosynthesis
MRVLLLTNLFPPDTLGGYELLAADVAHALRARGHDVEILTTAGDRAYPDEEQVHRRLRLVRPFGSPASLDRVRHALAAGAQRGVVRQLLRERPPFDVALVMSLRRLGLHAVREVERQGLRTVFCFNDEWLLAHRPGEGSTPARRWLWSTAERTLLSARTWRGVDFERAVYVSGATRDALRRGGAPVPDGKVAWQGVCPNTFAARPYRPVEESPRLLFAGRVHPTKGCDVALETLAELARAGVRATLSVAGTGEPEELARLRVLAERLEVSEQVRWLGFVPRGELGALYRASDVFLFPSRWNEPAGLTYLEAMSCGVPVVAMPTGGARELLVHEGNSLTVSDAEGMARAVKRLMMDPSLARSLVEGAHRTLRERASLDRYVTTIEGELRLAAQSTVARSA